MSLWTTEQLDQYHRQGYLMVRQLLSPDELAAFAEAVPPMLDGRDEVDQLHREYERSGAVRQVYLAHRHIPAFRSLAADPRIVEPVKQITGGGIYVWHSKLNVKDAFEGTVWLWHQDYGYWMWDGVDGRLVSVLVFFDPATIHNGCLMVVRGSHRLGRQEHEVDEVTTSYRQWCIPSRDLTGLIREDDIEAVTGQPGDVLFFDCNLIHGSNHNMSPLPRKSWIVAYNPLDNKPRPVEKRRPDWVVSRDFEPL